MSVRQGFLALLDPKQLPTRVGDDEATERLAAAASECLGIPAPAAHRLAERYLALGGSPGSIRSCGGSALGNRTDLHEAEGGKDMDRGTGTGLMGLGIVLGIAGADDAVRGLGDHDRVQHPYGGSDPARRRRRGVRTRTRRVPLGQPSAHVHLPAGRPGGPGRAGSGGAARGPGRALALPSPRRSAGRPRRALRRGRSAGRPPTAAASCPERLEHPERARQEPDVEVGTAVAPPVEVHAGDVPEAEDRALDTPGDPTEVGRELRRQVGERVARGPGWRARPNPEGCRRPADAGSSARRTRPRAVASWVQIPQGSRPGSPRRGGSGMIRSPGVRGTSGSSYGRIICLISSRRSGGEPERAVAAADIDLASQPGRGEPGRQPVGVDGNADVADDGTRGSPGRRAESTPRASRPVAAPGTPRRAARPARPGSARGAASSWRPPP